MLGKGRLRNLHCGSLVFNPCRRKEYAEPEFHPQVKEWAEAIEKADKRMDTVPPLILVS